MSYVFFGGDNIAALTGLSTAGSFTKYIIFEDLTDTPRKISPGDTKPGPSRWVRIDDTTPQELTPLATGDYAINMAHIIKLNKNRAVLEMSLFYYGTDYTVASKTAANPMVITTTVTHDIVSGEDVLLTGLSGVPDGLYLVTAVGATTITVDYDNSGGNTTGGGTVVQAQHALPSTYKISGNTAINHVNYTPLTTLTGNETYFVQVRLSDTNNASGTFYYNALRFITTG